MTEIGSQIPIRQVADKINLRQLVLPTLLFIVLWLAIGIPRTAFLISITDTEYLSLPTVTWDSLVDIFTDPPFKPWYRPLDVIIVSLEQSAFGNDFTPMIMIQAAIPAATSVAIYFLARELLKGRIIVAIASAILYPITLGVIETTWLFMHKVILSDFFVIFGILCYVRYTNHGSLKWLALLWASALIAPWIRELGGVLSAVVLFAAIVEKRKDIKLLISLPIFVFHALFASFFPALFLENRIELISIFTRATSGLFNSGVFSGSIGILNFDNPFRTVLYYSPIVTIGIFVAMALFFFSKRNSLNKVVGSIILFVLSISLLTMYVPTMPLLSTVVPFLFILAIVIPSFKFSKLLPIWFLVPIVPFMFIPVHDAWLKMAAVPFLILAFMWIDRIPALLNQIRGKTVSTLNAVEKQMHLYSKIDMKNVAGMLLFVLVIFSIPNLINAESTFRNNIITEQKIGEWFTENTPKGSAIISNLRQSWDFQYYSKDHVVAYLLDFRLKYPLPGGRGETLNTLHSTLSQGGGHPAYYFVIAEKFGTPGFPPIKDSDLEEVATFASKCSYPIVDPFQIILPDDYWRFGGPTDLKHEYETRRGLFEGECSAVFEVYRYLGDSTSLKKLIEILPVQFDTNSPVLWEEDYKGYNILGYRGTLYAIPQIDGDFNLTKFKANGYSLQFSSSDYPSLTKQLDMFPVYPQLSEQGYDGFNIIVFNGMYHAIPQSEGAFDIKRVESGGYSKSFAGGSLEKVKLMIDTQVPKVMDRNYRGYDIYSFNGTYYAILSGKTFDPLIIYEDNYPTGFISETFLGLKLLLSIPHFIESYKGFDVVLYESKYYAFPQEIGPFDPITMADGSDQIIMAHSLLELKTYLDTPLQEN